MSRGYFVKLHSRGHIRISGPERRDFLQSLITNDMDLLDVQECVYACLLTPQGKILFDFFVAEQGDSIFLECEGSARCLDLFNQLVKYRLRSKIEMEAVEKIDVYQLIGLGGGVADPRHESLGRRSLLRPDGYEEAPYSQFDRQRILLGIPDGSRDMGIGVSTLIECGLEGLGAVSFQKGCYVGQEVTARMHHRGLAKKRFYGIMSMDGGILPEPGTDLRAGEVLLGEMRSSCGDVGLALLKDDSVGLLDEIGLAMIE